MSHKRKGQLSLIMIVVIAFALILYAISINLTRISALKTQTTMASITGATFMASAVASYAELLRISQLKGNFDYCENTMSFWKLVTVGILLVVALVCSFIGPLGWLVVPLLIASAMTMLAIGIDLTVTTPALIKSWNKAQDALVYPQDKFMEMSLQNMLMGIVSDPVMIADQWDMDSDGHWWIPGSPGKGTDAKAQIPRLSYYYSRRLSLVRVTANLNELKYLADALLQLRRALGILDMPPSVDNIIYGSDCDPTNPLQVPPAHTCFGAYVGKDDGDPTHPSGGLWTTSPAYYDGFYTGTLGAPPPMPGENTLFQDLWYIKNTDPAMRTSILPPVATEPGCHWYGGGAVICDRTNTYPNPGTVDLAQLSAPLCGGTSDCYTNHFWTNAGADGRVIDGVKVDSILYLDPIDEEPVVGQPGICPGSPVPATPGGFVAVGTSMAPISGNIYVIPQVIDHFWKPGYSHTPVIGNAPDFRPYFQANLAAVASNDGGPLEYPAFPGLPAGQTVLSQCASGSCDCGTLPDRNKKMYREDAWDYLSHSLMTLQQKTQTLVKLDISNNIFSLQGYRLVSTVSSWGPALQQLVALFDPNFDANAAAKHYFSFLGSFPAMLFQTVQPPADTVIPKSAFELWLAGKDNRDLEDPPVLPPNYFYVNNNNWCLPEYPFTLPPEQQMSAVEVDFIYNSPPVTEWGTLDSVIKCLDWNSGNSAKFAACAAGATATACTGMPRSLYDQGGGLGLFNANPLGLTDAIAAANPFHSNIVASQALAAKEDAKFAKRSAYLKELRRRVQEMADIFSKEKAALLLPQFYATIPPAVPPVLPGYPLTTPPAASVLAWLNYMLNKPAPEPQVGNEIIYGWFSPRPKTWGMNTRTYTTLAGNKEGYGYLHLVQVSGALPLRGCFNKDCTNDARADPANTPGTPGPLGLGTFQSKFPWVKSRTENWGFTICYSLEASWGSVGAQVVRYDEDQDMSQNSVIKFMSGLPIWQIMFRNPMAQGSLPDVKDIIEACFMPGPGVRGAPASGDDQATLTGRDGEIDGTGLDNGLEGAFMLDIKTPNATTNQNPCSRVAKQFLQHGMGSKTCGRYYPGSGQMAVEMTKCE